MKTQNATQNQNLFQPISQQEVENLTREVKETVARQANTQTTLSAAQLYHIQRTGRKLTYKRSMLW